MIESVYIEQQARLKEIIKSVFMRKNKMDLNKIIEKWYK